MSSEAERIQQFLAADYRSKVELLTGQYGRILTRSSFFIGLITAMFGAAAFSIQSIKSNYALLLICLTGFLISLLWMLTAIADRRLVTAYRDDVRSAYALALQALLFGEAPDESATELRSAIEQRLRQTTDAAPESRFSAVGDVGERGTLSFLRFSVTRMPIWAASGAAFLWLSLLGIAARRPDLLTAGGSAAASSMRPWIG